MHNIGEDLYKYTHLDLVSSEAVDDQGIYS
jgi:hypothetical protein